MSRMKLNQGHYEAALDRCINVVRIIDLVLKEYPVIEQDAQLNHLIEGACSEVFAVAGLIANKLKEGREDAILDRAYWMFELVNELLIEHPVIAKDQEANLCANQAADALWQLYQYIGGKPYHNEQVNNKPANKGVRKRT